MVAHYTEYKKETEIHEKDVAAKNEAVAKLTTELSEVGEKLEEMKEAIESKDSGRSDTSPVLRVKEALKQIKEEIRNFDLRIGVASHSLLAAKVTTANRRRLQAAQQSRRRRNRDKGGKFQDEDSQNSGDEI